MERTTQRLPFDDVPPCPFGSAKLTTYDSQRVYDSEIEGDPVRWRYDGKGLLRFMRYFPDHATASPPVFKQIYSRPRP